MFSQATADGALTLTVTFALGTDLDNAQVQVQNRVAQALPRLPAGSAAHRRHDREGVARLHHGRAPRLAGRALRHALPANYALLQRQGRAGAHRRRRQRAGLRRRRLQHARLARSRTGSRRAQLTASDVVARDPRAERAGRGRRARRAAGAERTRPSSSRSTRRAGSRTEDEFGDIVVKRRRRTARSRGCATSPALELGASRYALRSLLDNKPAVAIGVFQRAGLERARRPRPTCARRWSELKKSFPQGVDYRIVYDPTVFVRESIDAVVAHAASRRSCWS